MDVLPVTAERAPALGAVDASSASWGWNAARIERMKELWTEGVSATDIAAELKHGITRNAVIGKVHRLKLTFRKKPPQFRPNPHRVAGPKPLPRVALAPRPKAPAKAVFAAPTPAPLRARVERVAEAPPVLDSHPCTIMELKERMCRWPFGDPAQAEFRYCGGTSGEGHSYCAYHSRVAYQPAVDRNSRQKQASTALLRAS